MQPPTQPPVVPPWLQPQPRIEGPPQKKARTTAGGTVVTKYAPPPGYVPPTAQPFAQWPHPGYLGQGPYGSYAPPFAGYAQQHPIGYPPMGQQTGQSAYPGQQYAFGQQMQQQQYSGWTGQPASYQAPQPLPAGPPPAPRRKSNGSANGSKHPDDLASEKIFLQYDELPEDHPEYNEFTRPCYYANRETEIVKDLSLGLIHSKTAQPAHNKLPTTWNKANTTALVQPLPEKFDASKKLSKYTHGTIREEEHNTVPPSADSTSTKDEALVKNFPKNTSYAMKLAKLRELRDKEPPKPSAGITSTPVSNISMQSLKEQDTSQATLSTQQKDDNSKKRVFSLTDVAQEVDAASKKLRSTLQPPDQPQQNVEVSDEPRPMPQSYGPSQPIAEDSAGLRPSPSVQSSDQSEPHINVAADLRSSNQSSGQPHPDIKSSTGTHSPIQPSHQSDPTTQVAVGLLPFDHQHAASPASTSSSRTVFASPVVYAPIQELEQSNLNHNTAMKNNHTVTEADEPRPMSTEIAGIKTTSVKDTEFNAAQSAEPVFIPEEVLPTIPGESRWQRLAREYQRGAYVEIRAQKRKHEGQ